MMILAIAIVVAAVIIAFTLDTAAKQISSPLQQQAEELKEMRSKFESLRLSVRDTGIAIQDEIKEVKADRDEQKAKVRFAEDQALRARIADGSARVFEG